MPPPYDDVTAGQFVAAAQVWLLKQPDGSLQADRATAARLQGFLLILMMQLGEAKGAVEAVPTGVGTTVQRGRLLNEIMLAEGRLQGMLDIANLYIERGDFNEYTGPIFYCVTSPLLLGWRGNAECSGVDPDQKAAGPGMAGEPIRIMRAAEALSEFEASQEIGLLTQYMLEAAAELPGKAAQIVEDIADALEKKAKELIGKQAIMTTIGLAAVGIAAVLYYGSKR